MERIGGAQCTAGQAACGRVLRGSSHAAVGALQLEACLLLRVLEEALSDRRGVAPSPAGFTVVSRALPLESTSPTS